MLIHFPKVQHQWSHMGISMVMLFIVLGIVTFNLHVFMHC